MSVAESAIGGASVVRPHRRASLRFLGSELRLIFGRRRNLAGMAVLASVPILLAVAVKVSTPRDDGRGPDFLSAITGNGLFVALASLSIELGLFLPLAVAAISADAVAGEANIGTLRYLLTIPVQRTRLLAVKYAAIVIFTVIATLWVSFVGCVIGVALFGGGPMTLLSGTQIGFGDALWRVVLASLYLAAGFAALGAVGLFVSTLTEQPIGATIAIVVINVASFIADSIPQLGWLHPWLITHWWMSFGDLLRDPISWDGPLRGLTLALGYAVVFWLAAWARFAGKDVTS
ncbi:ABC transporter permease [Oryzihumus leptocrescens]|uniref:ABC-2 type transport system permease protein n=1 Tax=Oryzihumus leptocrescens TaxID=297536 RepID=A0A542Z9L5_9MICO|nr:ABC transporter permease [Oryzihumus leptocrescens]TQL57048.1 ABC-2 type transport system permease protein [Oryzihumus leptocrescens]